MGYRRFDYKGARYARMVYYLEFVLNAVLDVQHPIPIRPGLWQRTVLHHKQRFFEHPRVMTIMLVWSTIRICEGSIAKLPFRFLFCYFFTFVLVPFLATLIRSHSSRPTCTTGSDIDSRMIPHFSSQLGLQRSSSGSPFSSTTGPQDLNRYHPHASVNRSSPFYRG